MTIIQKLKLSIILGLVSLGLINCSKKDTQSATEKTNINPTQFAQKIMNAPLDVPPAKIAKLPMGDMEYGVYGEGKPILVIHGGMGGYDQGIFFFKRYIPAGYQIISPSRPGYMGTPLSTGKTAEEQADAMAALLDYLKIPSATIVSISAGGLYLYPFVIRHPQKTKGFVAIDSVSGPYFMPEKSGKFVQALYLSRIGSWLVKKMSYYFPMAMMRNIVKIEGYLSPDQLKTRMKEIENSPESLEILTNLLSTMTDYKTRMPGTDNDLAVGKVAGWVDFDKITRPALIIHGTHDADVKFYNGVFAYEGLASKEKERFWIEYGTHFAFFLAPSAPQAQQKFREFIMKY